MPKTNLKTPTPQEPCYDCGSTIPGHHTPLCELAQKTAIRDLPQNHGTQHWKRLGIGDVVTYRKLPNSRGVVTKKSTIEVQGRKVKVFEVAWGTSPSPQRWRDEAGSSARGYQPEELEAVK